MLDSCRRLNFSRLKLHLLFFNLESSASSEITIHHPLPVYFRVKPALRTPSGKRCRKSRTVFTDLQLRVLEKKFSEQRYLDSTNRTRLSQILGLNEAQVKTWFQNRRMKWKRREAKTDKPDSFSMGKKGENLARDQGNTDKETMINGGEKFGNTTRSSYGRDNWKYQRRKIQKLLLLHHWFRAQKWILSNLRNYCAKTTEVYVSC